MKDKRRLTENMLDGIDDVILEKASSKRFSLFGKASAAKRKRRIFRSSLLVACLALVISVAVIIGGSLNPSVDGIVAIELTENYGEIDVYTIKYSDGKEASLLITNGSDTKINDVTHNDDGEVILALSNGRSVNLGTAVGDDGSDPKVSDKISAVAINELDKMSITLLSNSKVELGKAPTGDESHGHTLNAVRINADGELVVGFSSGELLNLGRVRGEDGVGIAGMEINADGELVVTLTDGTVLNLGNVKGADGIGISETYINGAGELCITYTDGVSVNLGRIVGERGESGVGISNIVLNDSYELEINLTDGRFLNLGSVRGETGMSAYEMYCEMYGYDGSEEQWLYDLVNGNLALRDSYNVMFSDPEGGTHTTTQNVGKGNKAIEPTAPVRAGYRFEGWFIDDDKWIFAGYTVTSDITLRAKWSLISYDIRYNLDGGELEGQYITSYTVADSFTLPVAKRYGYDFIGWTYDGQSEPQMNVRVENSTGSLTFTANYRAASFSVTLDAGAGAVSDSNLTATYTAPLTIPNATPPLGYNFERWALNGSTVTSGDAWRFGEDITLTAVYTPIRYNIVYLLDGGSISADNQYTVEDRLTIPKPYREHYVFLGWTYGNQTVPTLNAKIYTGTTGDLTFTAHWEKCRYTIEFYGNGGGVDYDCVDMVWGEPTLSNPRKYGLEFGGWYLDPDFTGEALTVVPMHDAKLYAKWIGETPLSAFDYSNNTIYDIVDKSLTEIVFPSHYAGAPINTNIDSFSLNTTVRKITVNGIIPSNLCSKLPALREIVFANCGTVPENLFSGCTSLISVEILNGVFEIGDSAFAGCTSLTTVKIHDAVNVIGDRAFAGCTSLNSVVLSEGLTEIGEGAFSGTALTSITLPSTLTVIGDNAFEKCGAIDVYVSDVDYIWSFKSDVRGSGFLSAEAPMSGSPLLSGGRLFVGGELLTELVVPEYITELTGGLFNGCSSITSIVLHSGITKICDYAFYKMTGTKSIVIPEGVTEIGQMVLYDCSSLEELHLPSTVTKLGFGALQSKGVDIYITDLLAYCRLGNFGSGSDIAYGEGKFGYDRGGRLFLNGELLTELVIPEELTAVPGDVFSGCTSITKVVLHSGITSISSSAFQWCENLVEIEIPSSVTTIECFAFNGCTSLKEIVIPDSVTKIANGAFDGCTSLTGIFYCGNKNTTVNNWNLDENILFFYSASKPDSDGKYWHFDVDGNPVAW